MHGAVLAAVTPSNTPHGSNMTAIVPVLVFVFSAAALYLRLRRPPQVVPGHMALASSRWANGAVSATETAAVAEAAPAASAAEAAPAAEAVSAADAGDPAGSAEAGESAGSGE